MGKFRYIDEVNNIERDLDNNKENKFIFIEDENNDNIENIKIYKKDYGKEESIENKKYKDEEKNLEEEKYKDEEKNLEEEKYKDEEKNLEDEKYKDEEKNLEDEKYKDEEKNLEDEKFKDEEKNLEDEEYKDKEKNENIVNELAGVDLSKIEKEENFVSNSNRKSHFVGKKKELSYIKRVIINIILLLIFVVLFSIFINKAFVYNREKRIKYLENGEIDYKVNLKENDFYDKPYLDKNMMYVANLIKNIDIDFNYDFNIEESTSMDFDYEIKGDLIIASEENENIIGSKSYTLMKKKNLIMKNQSSQKISENVLIDYDYYNEIANKFKMDYGIDSKSYLKVYLIVHKKNYTEISSYKIDENKELAVTIPLSQKAINIKIDSEKINGENEVISKNNSISDINYINIILSIVFLIFVIIVFVKLLKLLILLIDNESKYDKFIKKILNEYDRLIVETTNMPNFSKNDIIKINKFTELLDVRDNLKLPIMYYVVTEHHKSYFYIKKDNEIYLLTVKAVDL